MATHTSPRRMTYREFRAMPDDGKRHELVDGVPVVTPSPIPRHQVLEFRIAAVLTQAADLQAGALVVQEVDVRFTDYRATRPDIVYVSAESRFRVVHTHIEGPPDLIVEVLSPKTRGTDLGRKLAWYAEYNVPEYWIVDSTTPKVQILRRPVPGGYQISSELGEHDTLATPLLPGLAVSVSSLYDGLPD